MDCEVAREALSARIDGEREAVPSARVDEHLDHCGDCCAWYAGAVEFSRLLKVRSAINTPDLTSQILSSAGLQSADTRDRSLRRWIPRGRYLRIALVVIGLAQLVLGAAQIFGLEFGMLHAHNHSSTMTGMAAEPDMSTHLFNETTAWNIAIGVGLIVAGIRTRTTAGLLPVLGVFVFALTGFVISDALGGQVTVPRIASHSLVVLGLLVLVAAHYTFRDAHYPPPGRSAKTAEENEGLELPPGAKFGRSRGHLRPADDPAA